MDRKKADVIWLCISIVSYLFMSIMFLLMPLDHMISSWNNGRTVVMVGAGFWSFMMMGTAAQIVLARRRKAWYRARGLDERRSSARKVGIISFGVNIFAMIADVSVLVSLCGLIVSAVCTNASGYICYLFLAALIFSFCMHCILNGKIYYHITHHYKSTQTCTHTDAISEHQKTEGEQ